MIFEYFRSRRTFGWFVGAALLGLVILAFIVLYFPDFMGDPTTAQLRQEVARVEGEPIRAQTWLERYRQTARMYQEQMGDQFDAATARQMGLPRQVLSQIVMDRLLVIEATRQGVSATDAEVSESIREIPAFIGPGGAFVGRAAYLQILQNNRLNPRDFEASVRDSLLTEKLRGLVTLSADVSPSRLVEEYRRRNESASLEAWFLPASAHSGDVEVSEEEAKAAYEADPAAWERPTERRIRFFTLSDQTFADEVAVNQREIRRRYERNLFRYQTDDRAEAAHILLQAETEADEESTRELAASLADRARAGEDFAELARRYSTDEDTKDGGGELGMFGADELLPEFAEAVFALQPGEISDPIETADGFHVVLLKSREDATTTPLDEVSADLETEIREEKAAEMLTTRLLDLAEEAAGAGSLEDLTAAFPLLSVQETDWFGADDLVPELGSFLPVTTLAFELEVGSVGGPAALPTGHVFLEVAEERPPHVPDFETLREDVIEEVGNDRAMAAARAEADALVARLRAGDGSGDVDPTDLPSWLRGSPLGAAGLIPTSEGAIFGAEAGDIVGPFDADAGFVVVRVRGTDGYDEAAFEEQKDDFRSQLVNEERELIWRSFVSALEDRYDVVVDERAVQDLISQNLVG